MASSSSGGSGTSGGSRPPSGGGGSGGYSGGQPPRSGGGGTGGRDSGQSPFSSSSRPTRPTVPTGQERQVSYQREEERYWTDYLRVALPVVGLLLMLGLFWYWAGSLIGDDDDEEPTPISQVLTSPSPTPTAPLQVDISPTVGDNEAAQTDDGQEEPDPTPTDEPDSSDGEDGAPADGEDAQQSDAQEEPDSDRPFAAEDQVVVSEDVRLRTEPTTATDENVVTNLVVGTELTILDVVPDESDGYFWVEVEDLEGNTGYVAEEFLTPSE